ncbi:DUF4139 domain-containing protein [Candidatus Riflebacteria bacterium]
MLLFLLFFFCIPLIHAKIELSTLPGKEGVVLTIYKSRDLTLVKERRVLTFQKGLNKLDFSWAGTLIDPTSVLFKALPPGEDLLEVIDLSFPKNIKDTLVWNIHCKKSGSYAIELSYFTSGISWKGTYLFIVNPAETELNLQLFVTITNNSGEDFLKAKTRLVIGKLNLVEEIARLAKQEREELCLDENEKMNIPQPSSEVFADMVTEGEVLTEKKEIKKEGLSEYFLYTIAGTEDIKAGWRKKINNLDKKKVPFKAFYKYDTDRWGTNIRRYYRFKNDKNSELGEEPLPNGRVIVYTRLPDSNALKFIGQAETKYIPIEEKVDLDLGYEKQITLKKRLMDYRTGAFHFHYNGNIDGWNEYKFFEIEIKNRRSAAAQLELKEHFHGKWTFEIISDEKPEKEDYRTLKYDLHLKANESRKIRFKITQFQGKNAEGR